jgi:hypothetical protein
MRHILNEIPFPRLRLAGDDTRPDTLRVIPGRSEAQGKKSAHTLSLALEESGRAQREATGWS